MSAAEELKGKGFGTRSKYSRIVHHRTRRELAAWWGEHRYRWRLNTRYDSQRGLTEYWHCAHKEEGIYICPARLKVIFRGNQGIAVYESKNREHDHNPLPPPNLLNVHETIVMEPFPLQTAQIVDMTPRFVSQPPKLEMTSTEKTGSRKSQEQKESKLDEKENKKG
ncbi:hypothetical protein ACQ4LE_000267 [Meloidogyne hapla]|uniref:FLYWCH-type domain-containing protein n=1 Tax=Meloidogyne hapla TaxID=6305 RepID=A0A1I8BA58_MELHA